MTNGTAAQSRVAPARTGLPQFVKGEFEAFLECGILEHSPQCDGEFWIIAAIEEPAVIVRLLAHPGLPERALPRSPARPLALFQAAWADLT